MNSAGLPLYRQSVRAGALYLLLSTFVFSFAGILVKLLSGDVPLETIVFFRNGGSLIVMIPWILLQQDATFRTRHFWNHSLRALSGVMAMYCFFYAIARLPLAEAISLNFTSPIILPMMAYLVSREKVRPQFWLILLIGFAGVLMILRPGLGQWNTAGAVGFASAFFASFALANVRRLTHTEPAYRVVFYFSAIASLLTLVPMLLNWSTPGLSQWFMLIGIGVLATLGQWLLTRGYASGPAGQVGFFHYSAVIFGGLIDWLIWGQIPDALSLAGVGMICAAGVATMYLCGRNQTGN